MRSCVAVSRWRTFFICGPAGHSLGWGRLPESHLSTRSERLAPLLPPWGSAQDLTSQPRAQMLRCFPPTASWWPETHSLPVTWAIPTSYPEVGRATPIQTNHLPVSYQMHTSQEENRCQNRCQLCSQRGCVS